jgi:hypothetical protein
MPDAFPSTAFQSLLAIEAILFGVFGFLYSVYAMFSSLATPEKPARAPICNILRQLCRVMVALLILDGFLFLYSLYLLGPTGLPNRILAGGLVVSMAAMVWISARMAFFYME